MEGSSAQMCHDLITMLRRIKAALIVVAEKHDMTAAQLGTLYAVYHGDSTMHDVAHTMHCDASNATGLVDRLVAQGLVVRSEHHHDRRVKALHLTQKGQKTIESAIEKLPIVMGCQNLSARERGSIHDAVGKLTAL